MADINTKMDLLTALQDSNERAEKWFIEIPANAFFARSENAWSPSDNVDHLIKAVAPVAKALRLPKITLRAMFGKPEKTSMRYEELCKRYRDEIARGGQASGRFLPEQQTPSLDAGEKKTALLEQWSKANQGLLSVVKEWDEADLDQYLLPHPLLGKLTVREMIFFTIYHNLRHASLEGD